MIDNLEVKRDALKKRLTDEINQIKEKLVIQTKMAKKYELIINKYEKEVNLRMPNKISFGNDPTTATEHVTSLLKKFQQHLVANQQCEAGKNS